jgi:molybdopterin-guanine dinucleotide biosynthesis adapter protein
MANAPRPGARRRDPALGHRGSSVRVFGFAGWSGSGKTTLIEAVVPRLVDAGLSVSLVKHAHHAFDVDQPGKDSWRHRRAGCSEVLVSSGVRWALMHELRGNAELSLSDAIRRLSACDVVLVEGYKRAAIPKLEIWREALGKPMLHPGDPAIVAVATDAPGRLAASIPVFALDDPGAIATFIAGHAAAWPATD